MLGEAFDCTAIENGLLPDATPEERAGRNRTLATPSASGKSESVDGSTIAHRDGSPTTWISYWSTTLLLLCTRTSQLASSPGLTAIIAGAIATVTPPERASVFVPTYARKAPHPFGLAQNSTPSSFRKPHLEQMTTTTAV